LDGRSPEAPRRLVTLGAELWAAERQQVIIPELDIDWLRERERERERAEPRVERVLEVDIGP